MRKIIFFILLTFYFSGCGILTDMSDNIRREFLEIDTVSNKLNNFYFDSVRLSALWVGHETVLLQMDDKVIITDPFFTENIAMLQRRIIEAGYDLKNLNKLDFIVLSHSHFDHTNLGSLGLLEKKFPTAKLIFPEGLEYFLPDYTFDFIPIKKADEKNKVYIGESKIIDGVKFTAVATFHWGGRYGLDGLIWGYDSYTAYIIEYNGMKVFFAGDTSYDEDFSDFLGLNYSFDISILPVGPCSDCEGDGKPYRHIYPEGVVKMIERLKSDSYIIVHYGTIKEKSEPDFPKEVLENLIDKKPNLKSKVKFLKIGEQLIQISGVGKNR